MSHNPISYQSTPIPNDLRENNLDSLQRRGDHHRHPNPDQPQDVPQTQDVEIFGRRHLVQPGPDRHVDDGDGSDSDETRAPEEDRGDVQVWGDDVGDPVWREGGDPVR